MGDGKLLACVEIERTWIGGSGCDTYRFRDGSSLAHFIFSDGNEVLITSEPNGAVMPEPYDGRYPYIDRQAERLTVLRERRRGRELTEPARSAMKTIVRATILRKVYCKHDEATEIGAGGKHTGLGSGSD